MSQAKGGLAPAELDSGGPATPSWGHWASAPASRCPETWAQGEGLILPGALRPGCLCHLDICCPERSPIPVGGAPAPLNLPACLGARLGPALSPMFPGALASGGALQHWSLLCPSAPPQELRTVHQDRPPCCLEGFRGLPLLWERCMVLPEPGVHASPAPPRSSPGLLPWCLRLPSPPPEPGVPSEPTAWCYKGAPGVPVSLCRRMAAAWRGCIARALRVP